MQWNNSIKIKRAEYLSNLYNKLNDNKTIKSILYMFDYDKETWYDENFHNSGQLESDVDETLSFFSFICYIYESKLISKKEFNFFKYRIDRTLSSSQVEIYLYNVYHHCFINKTTLFANYLYNYIKKYKIYDDNFFSSENKNNYPIYLEWGKSIKDKQQPINSK